MPEDMNLEVAHKLTEREQTVGENRRWEEAIEILGIATGANPKEVARRAGHTSVRTVFDVYGHLLPDADDALVDALDALGRRVLAQDAGTGRVLELGNRIGGSQ
jgi:hypothetical protein